MTMYTDQEFTFGEPTGGKVGRNHPQTAVVASTNVRTGTQHAMVVEALWKVFPEGLTAYDLADGRVKNSAGRPVSPNQIATRLMELRERGFVEYVPAGTGRALERETTPGNTGLIQQLTDAGVSQSRNLRS